MSQDKIEKLVRMANQIGDFFQPMSDEAAIAGVAGHIRKFWTPKMIRELSEHAEKEPAKMQPRVHAALRSLHSLV